MQIIVCCRNCPRLPLCNSYSVFSPFARWISCCQQDCCKRQSRQPWHCNFCLCCKGCRLFLRYGQWVLPRRAVFWTVWWLFVLWKCSCWGFCYVSAVPRHWARVILRWNKGYRLVLPYRFSFLRDFAAELFAVACNIIFMGFNKNALPDRQVLGRQSVVHFLKFGNGQTVFLGDGIKGVSFLDCVAAFWTFCGGSGSHFLLFGRRLLNLFGFIRRNEVLNGFLFFDFEMLFGSGDTNLLSESEFGNVFDLRVRFCSSARASPWLLAILPNVSPDFTV